FKALVKGLEELGFEVTEEELCALDFGVPQTRRRVVLSGLRRGQGFSKIAMRKRKGPKTVLDAIGGLDEPAFFRRDLNVSSIPVHPNHWTMRPKSPRFSNPPEPTSNARSFKRLEWNRPSPTIALGHREIPIHPDGHRRLSIHEAMRLQGF